MDHENSSDYYDPCKNIKNEQLSHEFFIKNIKLKLNEIIKEETLLSNINPELNEEELKNILSLEHGESMTVFIRRDDNELLNLIVKQNATVENLKTAIESFYKSKRAQIQFPGMTEIINWKHVWKNYSLKFADTKLSDRKRSLRDYGVQHRSELRFERMKFRQAHLSK